MKICCLSLASTTVLFSAVHLAGMDNSGAEWVQAIRVTFPSYGSDISGNVTVRFKAPGMTDVKALCWQQPTPEAPGIWGHDAVVSPDIGLNADGSGSFVFPADQFPEGPITLRLYAHDSGNRQDVCELQLYNQGGVVWNQGIPKTDPPAASGMKRVYADDFDGPLSISATGNDARYQSHKTGGGDFSGFPFCNAEGPFNPFRQVGTFLRIRVALAAGTKGSTGILSSAHEDGSGFYASAPCYFECRLLAQSAPGAWPAFWLLTKGCLKKDPNLPAKGADELDVIEAYGGQGRNNPNFAGYAATSHFWDQPKPGWLLQKGPEGKPLNHAHTDVPMTTLGGKSTWSTTFHTYGVGITSTDTTYYCDDIEILRHPTGLLSKTQPFWFLIDYAIGGISGWHIDLNRYGNQSDMWIDYVRVYQGTELAPASKAIDARAGAPSSTGP